ncbi:MAG: STAS domain-containing protein, partial [Sphingomonadales bacterium]
MPDVAHHLLEDAGADGNRLVLSGQLTLASIGPLERDLEELAGPIGQVDLAGVVEIDTVGAWVVCRFARENNSEITGASPDAQRLLATMREIEASGTTRAEHVSVWERVPLAVGETVFDVRGGLYGVVGFFGQILIGV